MTSSIRPNGPKSPVAPTYVSWQRMKARCQNPRAIDYARYGGRGIKVCDQWSRFESFLRDMGERPAGTQLDRIDNEGDYEPSNCRWISKRENARNRSSNIRITRDGVTKTAIEWCEELGLPPSMVYDRIKSGWEPKAALLPKGSRRPVKP